MGPRRTRPSISSPRTQGLSSRDLPRGRARQRRARQQRARQRRSTKSTPAEILSKMSLVSIILGRMMFGKMQSRDQPVDLAQTKKLRARKTLTGTLTGQWQRSHCHHHRPQWKQSGGSLAAHRKLSLGCSGSVRITGIGSRLSSLACGPSCATRSRRQRAHLALTRHSGTLMRRSEFLCQQSQRRRSFRRRCSLWRRSSSRRTMQCSSCARYACTRLTRAGSHRRASNQQHGSPTRCTFLHGAACCMTCIQCGRQS